jgi:hypothetical protein
MSVVGGTCSAGENMTGHLGAESAKLTDSGETNRRDGKIPVFHIFVVSTSSNPELLNISNFCTAPSGFTSYSSYPLTTLYSPDCVEDHIR